MDFTKFDMEVKGFLLLILLQALPIFGQENHSFDLKEKVIVQDPFMAREPALALHPNGDLYVSGYEDEIRHNVGLV